MVEEDSPILKILRDPLSPKIALLVISFFQFCFNDSYGYRMNFVGVIVPFLTFLFALLLIVLIGGKWTEKFVNNCVFRCITGKPKLSWDGFYFTFTIVFGTLNFLMLLAYFSMGYGFGVLINIILCVIYFVEAYRHCVQNNDWKNLDNNPKRYARFLKFLGRSPVFTTIIILVLGSASAFFVHDHIIYTYYDYNNYNAITDKYHNHVTDRYGDYIYPTPIEKTNDYYSWGQAYTILMLISIGFAIFISIFNMFSAKCKCCRAKMDKFQGKGQVVRYTLSLIMTMIVLMGFLIGLARVELHWIGSILMGCLFIFSFFITIGYAHTHEDQDNGDDRSSILPENMPKLVTIPIVPELKTPSNNILI